MEQETRSYVWNSQRLDEKKSKGRLDHILSEKKSVSSEDIIEDSKYYIPVQVSHG